jgi:hypothetical protein
MLLSCHPLNVSCYWQDFVAKGVWDQERVNMRKMRTLQDVTTVTN